MGSPGLEGVHGSSVSGVWHPWKTQNKQENNPLQTSLSFLIFLKLVQRRKKPKKKMKIGLKGVLLHGFRESKFERKRQERLDGKKKVGALEDKTVMKFEV